MLSPNKAAVDEETTPEQLLLQHLARYRMTTLQVLSNLPEFRYWGRRSLRALVHRLCCEKRLGRAPLFGNRSYIHLGSRTAESPRHTSRDVPPKGPLSESDKIRCYAMLQFCCGATEHRRSRLTNRELTQHFPARVPSHQPVPYYVDTTNTPPRVGLMRVDTGGRGRWDRIVAKCRADLDAHTQLPGFRELLEAGQFELTLITALPQKAERLREAMSNWPADHTRHLRVVTVPDLLLLIAPPPQQTQRSHILR